jgi:hypothetical protein
MNSLHLGGVLTISRVAQQITRNPLLFSANVSTLGTLHRMEG